MAAAGLASSLSPFLQLRDDGPPSSLVKNASVPINLHSAIYGFGAVSLAISTMTTVLRLYTKIHIFNVRRWDDALMFVAWCCLVITWSFNIYAVRYGLGSGTYQHLQTENSTLLKYAFLHYLFYAIIQCLLKTSIALQIMNIFVPRPHSIFRNRAPKFWIIVIYIVLQDIWFTIFFWISLFQCTPVAHEFNSQVPGKCMPGWSAYNVVVSAWNVVSNILMLLFPLYCIWQLQMKNSQKLGAGYIFTVGAVAVASSILRLVFTIRSLWEGDTITIVTQIALCDAGEITAGIVVGNSVILPRFLKYTLHAIKAKRKGVDVKKKDYATSIEMWPTARDGPERPARPTSSQSFSFEDIMNASRIPRQNAM